MAQFTKKAICDTLLRLLAERPLDRISVVDIAEKSGINRNTFYYHFSDIYAVVDEIFRSETQRILSESANYDSWEEAFRQAVRFALENRQAAFSLYNSSQRDRLERYLYDVTLSSMEPFVRKQAEGLAVAEEDVRAMAVFYTSALLGLAMKWMQDGMRYDSDAFIRRISRLLRGSIRRAFELES